MTEQFVALQIQSSTSGEGHLIHESQPDDANSLVDTSITSAIRSHHRERCFWMEQRKRMDLTLGAYLRSELGWSLNKTPAEREAIRAQAVAIIASGEKHTKATRKITMKAAATGTPLALPPTPQELAPWAYVVMPQIEMRKNFDDLEDTATKKMVENAKKLPVHAWADGIRGFGPLGLAIIVGEAGDLSNYSTHSKLWKRLGLAVIDGVRQGGLPKTAPKQTWIEHGYNRRRRSRIYTIGSALVMSGDTPYRQTYLDRKAVENMKAADEGLIVAPAAKIPKTKQHEYRSLGHIDNRARRYTEKKLVRDLWKAWRTG